MNQPPPAVRIRPQGNVVPLGHEAKAASGVARTRILPEAQLPQHPFSWGGGFYGGRGYVHRRWAQPSQTNRTGGLNP